MPQPDKSTYFTHFLWVALPLFQRILLLCFLDSMPYVRTQFSKDDVEASDSLLAGLFDDDINGDDGVWVDWAAK
jgi:hypothetical protein